MAYFRKRGRKWYYTIETKGEHGERKKIERPGGLTKAECEKAYRAAMADVDETGDYIEPSKITVAEYFTQWMNEYVEVNLKYNTVRQYRATIRAHILPAIGSMLLRKVSGRTLQNFLNEKKETHKRRTLKSLCSILKKAFAYAAGICQYIRANPMDAVRVPKYTETPKEAAVFLPEQLQTIFQHFAPDHPCYMPIMLAYHTGMRKGECLALQWEDVDLVARVLHIRHTIVGATRKETKLQGMPKTASSVRDVHFGQKLCKILKAQKARQAARRLEYGRYYTANDFVCTWPDGSSLVLADMQKFNAFCKAQFGAGSFHSLRHTHATMLLEAGNDLELVAKRLGHSSINTTATTYSHVLEKRKARTIALLDTIL